MTTATSPVRGDSYMKPTETIVTRLSTEDGRFTATFDYQTRTYTLYDVRTKAIRDLLMDVNEVKRTVAQIVDDEHRMAVAFYTASLAATDPAIAAKVQEMRRAGAAHGRAMGTLGIWMSDRDVTGQELTVYVDRAEYEGLLAQ